VKDATTPTKPYLVLTNISIHASVKDATSRMGKCRHGFKNFNPRIREGCDLGKEATYKVVQYFNPRIREGCDKIVSGESRQGYNFNPRIREGCDEKNEVVSLHYVDISIHASVKDATPIHHIDTIGVLFQSTHP